MFVSQGNSTACRNCQQRGPKRCRLQRCPKPCKAEGADHGAAAVGQRRCEGHRDTRGWEGTSAPTGAPRAGTHPQAAAGGAHFTHRRSRQPCPPPGVEGGDLPALTTPVRARLEPTVPSCLRPQRGGRGPALVVQLYSCPPCMDPDPGQPTPQLSQLGAGGPALLPSMQASSLHPVPVSVDLLGEVLRPSATLGRETSARGRSAQRRLSYPRDGRRPILQLFESWGLADQASLNAFLPSGSAPGV